MKVLFIDDEQTRIEPIRAFIEMNGYEVAYLENLDDAYKEISSDPKTYHVIIVDRMISLSRDLKSVLEKLAGMNSENLEGGDLFYLAMKKEYPFLKFLILTVIPRTKLHPKEASLLDDSIYVEKLDGPRELLRKLKTL